MKIVKDGESSELDDIPVDEKFFYRKFYIDNEYIDSPHYYRTITVIIAVTHGTMMVINEKFDTLLVHKNESVIIYPGDIHQLKCFIDTCFINMYIIVPDIPDNEFFILDNDIVNVEL